MFIIQIVLEIAVVILIAYGIWHEEELAEWEHRTWQKIKRRWKS